jgi:hypothetical protein
VQAAALAQNASTLVHILSGGRVRCGAGADSLHRSEGAASDLAASRRLTTPGGSTCWRMPAHSDAARVGASRSLKEPGSGKPRGASRCLSVTGSGRSLSDEIAEQGEVVRGMKAAIKADAGAHSEEQLKVEVGKLLALKAQAAPAPEGAEGGAHPADDGEEISGPDDESYRQQRWADLTRFEEHGGTVFPHKFVTTSSIPAFLDTYAYLAPGVQASEFTGVCIAGRIHGVGALYQYPDAASDSFSSLYSSFMGRSIVSVFVLVFGFVLASM